MPSASWTWAANGLPCGNRLCGTASRKPSTSSPWQVSHSSSFCCPISKQPNERRRTILLIGPELELQDDTFLAVPGRGEGGASHAAALIVEQRSVDLV